MQYTFRCLVSFILDGGLLGHSVITAGIKASAFGVRVLAILWTAQKVEPALFGSVALYMTCAELSRIIADFGLDTRLTGMFANKSACHSGLIKQALVIKAFMGILGCLFFLLLVKLVGLTASPLLPAFLLMVISPLMLSLPANYKIARQEGHQAMGSAVTGGMLSLAAFTGLFAIPSVGVFALYVIPAAEMLVAFWLFRLLPVRDVLNAPVSGLDLRDLACSCLPVGIAIVLGAVYGRMDILFVSHFATTNELGVYGFSARLVEPMAFVGGALAVNTYSHVSGVVCHQPRDGVVFLKKYGKIIGIYAFSCGLAVALFAIFIMIPLFPLYESSQWIVLVFAGIIMCRCMNLFFTAGIQGYGKFFLTSKLAVLNLIIMMMLMSILVPSYGTLGAACAILGVESMNCIFQPWLLHRIVRSEL